MEPCPIWNEPEVAQIDHNPPMRMIMITTNLTTTEALEAFLGGNQLAASFPFNILRFHNVTALNTEYIISSRCRVASDTQYINTVSFS